MRSRRSAELRKTLSAQNDERTNANMLLLEVLIDGQEGYRRYGGICAVRKMRGIEKRAPEGGGGR